MRNYYFLDEIKRYKNRDEVAYINRFYTQGSVSYRQVCSYSDKLAYYLQERLGADKTPLVVYGHKHPMMLVYFLACVKSGRAFCPVDVNTPLERVQDIIETVGSPLVLTTEILAVEMPVAQVTVDEAQTVIETTQFEIDPSHYLTDDETFYIIFTSGSTGKPKGVCVSYQNLNAFLAWFTGYFADDERPVFLGHPPFSFDLSVMSLWPALYMGARLVQIDRHIQQDFKLLFAELKESEATVWISTPSFIEMCFIDESFNADLLPHVTRFIFCGEKLFNTTVAKIHQRFPQAQVINTYGPTESTVMVTWVEITPELNARYATNLPVGKVKVGSEVRLLPLTEEPSSHKGEIQIAGDTVAQGYFQRPDLNANVFSQTTMKDGTPCRAYRTGDVGYFEDEYLFCDGRIDFQIKLHGHRIELEDIDANLLRLPHVRQAASVPVYREGKVHSIYSYVVYDAPVTQRFETIKQLKAGLKAQLPEYMIPKKIVFLEAMPLNQNGKIDKRKLRTM